MDRVKRLSDFQPSAEEGARKYLYDMVGQLAQLAREAGEVEAAIYLEAIIAAQRATLRARSASA